MDLTPSYRCSGSRVLPVSSVAEEAHNPLAGDTHADTYIARKIHEAWNIIEGFPRAMISEGKPFGPSLRHTAVGPPHRGDPSGKALRNACTYSHYRTYGNTERGKNE